MCYTIPPKTALSLSLKMYSIIYEPTFIHAALYMRGREYMLCDLLIRFSLSTAAILFRVEGRNSNRVSVSLTSVEKIRSIFMSSTGKRFFPPISVEFFARCLCQFLLSCVVFFDCIYAHTYDVVSFGLKYLYLHNYTQCQEGSFCYEANEWGRAGTFISF